MVIMNSEDLAKALANLDKSERDRVVALAETIAKTNYEMQGSGW